MSNAVSALSRASTLALAVLALGACSGDDDADGPTPMLLPSQPPGTDVWLAPLETNAAGELTVGSPRNVTGRPGYDNQPHFTPDGSGFWYTAADELNLFSYPDTNGNAAGNSLEEAVLQGFLEVVERDGQHGEQYQHGQRGGEPAPAAGRRSNRVVVG